MFFAINFPESKTMLSYGRNGTIKTTGIHVYTTDNGIDISPITSKKTIGNCNIQIHYAVIPELIKKLKETYLCYSKKFPTPITDKPNFCPECGSPDVNFGDIDSCNINEETGLVQHCKCNNCGEEWKERFEFFDKEREN